MFRMITMLAYFLRELIFDSKEEYNFRSRRFNARKVLIFILISCSFLTSILLTNRLYKLALENIELREEIRKCEEKNISPLPSDSAKAKTISSSPKQK